MSVLLGPCSGNDCRVRLSVGAGCRVRGPGRRPGGGGLGGSSGSWGSFSSTEMKAGFRREIAMSSVPFPGMLIRKFKAALETTR